MRSTPPPSQPVIDILTVDFTVPRQSLAVDLEVLDLDHAVIGPYGSGPEDTVYYAAAFELANGYFGALIVERDSTGAVVASRLNVYTGFGDLTERPAASSLNVRSNTVHMEVELSVLNDAYLELCPECTPVGRGTVLPWTTADARVIDNDPLFGVVLYDWTPWGPPYTVGH